MARTNRSRYTILACLSVEPMSGYDVKQFLEETVAHFWSESYGQIYPTLKTLEADGLVAGHDESPVGGGRERRTYSLTESGLEALREWLRKPPEPEVPRYEISLKLFFGDQLSREVALEHVRRHRQRHREILENYHDTEVRLKERLAGSPRLPYWLAVLRGGIRYSTTVIEWCDETAASLQELDPEAYPAEPTAPIVTESDRG